MLRRSIAAHIVLFLLALPLAGAGCSDSKGPAPAPNADGGAADPAESAARAQLASLLGRYGIQPGDVVVETRAVDDLGFTHVRFQQELQGVPVFAGEAIVHLRPDGTLFDITDSLVDHPNVSTTPQLTPAQAVTAATTSYGCVSCLTDTPTSELDVLRYGAADHLVYQVRLRREDGTDRMGLPVLFIDAHGGNLVWSYDDLKSTSAPSLYSGMVNIKTYRKPEGGSFYLEDLTAKVGTHPSGTPPTSFVDADDTWHSPAALVAIDAHWGAEKTLEFYAALGRSGIDGKGGPAAYLAADGTTGLIGMEVHLTGPGGAPVSNAYWNGRSMIFGDGDGLTRGPFVSLDICAHELTHGVMSATAKLIYTGEGGALHESWADAFGAAVWGRANGNSPTMWWLAHQIVLPAGGPPLRYLDEPNRLGHPDHFRVRKTTISTVDAMGRSTNDQGNVHANAGISNKAFFLVVKGGDHRLGGTLFDGSGIEVTTRIWYDAMANYMTAATNFAGARVATTRAAEARYGTDKAAQVQLAWGLVGVGGCDDRAGKIGRCPTVCTDGVAQAYNITDLGQTRPTALNVQGDVVGNNVDAQNVLDGTASLWDRTGTRLVSNLGGVPGFTFSSAAGINDVRQITGAAADQIKVVPMNTRAFRYTYDSVNMAITTRDIVDDAVINAGCSGVVSCGSQGMGINNSGQVAVSGYYAPCGPAAGTPRFPMAFVWPVGGAPIDLGSTLEIKLPSTTNCTTSQVAIADIDNTPKLVNAVPAAINDAGQVVGFAQFAHTPIGTPSVGVPIRTGANQPIAFTDYLGTLNPDPTMRSGAAASINSDGNVVGRSNPAQEVPFFFDGAMHALAPAASTARAAGINTSGVIVGTSDACTGNTACAVIWYQGKTIELNSLLPAGSDWKLRSASAINSCGAIVGVGERPTGAQHGYLLTPAKMAP